jgi:hypothetical protein
VGVGEDNFIYPLHVPGREGHQGIQAGASIVTCFEWNDHTHRPVLTFQRQDRGVGSSRQARTAVTWCVKLPAWPGHAILGFLLRGTAMVELLRSNDLVLLSYVLHLLREAGITPLVFDQHTSAVEGSIGALPRRIMVDEDELARARRVVGNIALTIPR